MNHARTRLQRKEEFYSGLDSATDSDDDTPDRGRESSMKALQRGAIAPRVPKLTGGSSGSGISRSNPDRKVNERRKEEGSTHPLKDIRPTQSADEKPMPPSRASFSTRQTFSGSPSKPMAKELPAVPKATGKRKRSTEIKQMPEKQQVFKGLVFYFFPNNDTNPARKMRITKALEFGATWQKDFNESVTHVIVDKSLDYNQLLKYLKRDSLPERVVVASENYPAECISFRALLNARQLQFKVKGHEQMQAARPSSSSSDKSLLLKAAGKQTTARQPQTQSPDRSPSPSASSESGEEGINPAAPTRSHKPCGVKHDSKVQSTEEFDDILRQARELQHVPLDNDDEPMSRPSSSEGPGSGEEEQPQGMTLLKKKRTKLQQIQDKFQCMQKHTGSNTETPNAGTIAILQQMANYYEKTGDEWRVRAYRKAMSTLRNRKTKVWTKEEALALPQIGERLATKIVEIAFTNRLRRLENAKAEPSDQVLQTFMGVYGVGYAQASKWVDAGFTTLDALLENAELTTNQRIGIEHYEDFNSRIPRAEVEQHGNIVKKTLQKIDPAFEVIVGGSYRRGAETSGDIDCIITRPDTGDAHIRQVVLDQLVPKLMAKKFLVAELAATDRDDGSKWHGASQLPSSSSGSNRNPWRRIDLLLVPSAELGAALIYFTGNDIFNRSMRLLAGTKGMRLNQRGLYGAAMRGKGRVKLSQGKLLEGKDEKRIFEILGVPWRPPEHRVC